ncbi:hypothetical protein TRIUR3_32449 [Triticum urartu]|uniref:Uncharacterized protein n=1 Tax=Triticum urartu TaxID=4572 RepID=M7Z5V9_TRIUA|nr:hypothetical protein TRIUR3_32449 [Triticum urartu]
MSAVSGFSPARLLTNHRLPITSGDLQLGEVSNYSWRRSQPVACRVCRCHRCPHTVDAAATCQDPDSKSHRSSR